MSDKTETKTFQAETKQLLDLMIHSLYSEKEIFLRELISNASDAMDKLRFEAITHPDLQGDERLEIRIETDPEARTITVHDNGIGMTREEVVENIGTIAKSGTKELLQKVKDAPKDQTLELIGQFGVGFYASFMAAERVTLLTRKAGERGGTRWESTGDGTYEIAEAPKVDRGTSVTLHLKDADPEKGLSDFTQEWVITETVKKYSDFVRYPILLKVSREEPELDAEGKPVEGGKTTIRVEDKTLNSMKAIWKRRKSEVTDEEYADFYKQVAKDWEKPLETIVLQAEGRIEYQALLFIPQKAGMDLYLRGHEGGLQLYVKNVKIMERCEELLPAYLRFVNGVVDCADLPLNVSREILQNDGQVAQIRKGLVKKVLDTLRQMREKEPKKYTTFWKQFGRALKEGIATEAADREALTELLLVSTSAEDGKEMSLRTYVERMKQGQDTIFYISGENEDVVRASPHLEGFRDKGYEVVFFTDPVDEFMLQWMSEYDGKKLKSIAKGDVQLGSEEERKEADEKLKAKQSELEALLGTIQRKLADHVKEVRLSSRLTSSPVCLVSDENEQSAYFQRLLQQSGGAAGAAAQSKRIMELNAEHPVIEAMKSRFESNASDPVLGDYAELLLGQALLAEGSELPHPAQFGKLVTNLMVQSAQAS